MDPSQNQTENSAVFKPRTCFKVGFTLHHHLPIYQRSVWSVYKGIQYSSNQGTGSQGFAILSHAKRFGGGEDPSIFYIVRREDYALEESLKAISQPIHQNIVGLQSVFAYSGAVYAVYEKMEASLEQIFFLDIVPWSVNQVDWDEQMCAISYQVILGVHYLHSKFNICHGEIIPANVLINHRGTVKLANAARSILCPDNDFVKDFRNLADLVRTLAFAAGDDKPTTSLLKLSELCSEGALASALEQKSVQNARHCCLESLAVAMGRVRDPVAAFTIDNTDPKKHRRIISARQCIPLRLDGSGEKK